MEEGNFTVYMHICPNGKKYIGVTCRDVNKRWINGNGYKGQFFYTAIKKYGWDNIQHIIVIENLTQKQADIMEIDLIKYWDTANKKNGYNIAKGGSNWVKYCPICQFDKKGRYIATYNGVRAASKNTQSNPSAITQVCKNNKKTTNGFIWKYLNDPIFNKYPIGTKDLENYIGISKDRLYSKSIYQYSLDGELIKKWDSAVEVSHSLGFNLSYIHKACKGYKRHAYKYIWKYCDTDYPKLVTKINLINRSKKVNQYSLDGKFIKEWVSIRSVTESLKIDNSAISKVCRGIYNSTGGYKWKYSI